uniref:Uncharacterized protein n=1 Tax=Quercus lobata TaxID=97700 RepID=A0A7N2MBJ8_QUELO
MSFVDLFRELSIHSVNLSSTSAQQYIMGLLKIGDEKSYEILCKAFDCEAEAIFEDQSCALDMIRDDTTLQLLGLIQAPLVDVEFRGVPALKFLGDIISSNDSQS